MDDIRRIRNQLLAASDWTQMPDAPLGPETREAWAAYRRALRDVTEGVTDPAQINWPLRPDQQE
ncbi:tail fiber assembly protein [Roseovarius sp. MS2]|uniref:tail fiber assembly protein n=1 Tax=Roseovarius sp. MS2 TaxID=3390728 RepID=UPI003EDC0AC3